MTLIVGLRFLRVHTPWQLYLLAAYAAFVGEAAEGMVVDTDHWRHFFLLLGLIWGLSVATINWRRGHGPFADADVGAMAAQAAPL